MKAKGTCKGVFSCACGYDVPLFVCEGEQLPNELTCCICGTAYALNWQFLPDDKATEKIKELRAKGEFVLEMEDS